MKYEFNAEIKLLEVSRGAAICWICTFVTFEAAEPACYVSLAHVTIRASEVYRVCAAVTWRARLLYITNSSA